VPLRDELADILATVGPGRSEEFKQHPLAIRLREDAAAELTALVDDPSYLVEGSGGRGKWAETVWISVFDRLVTESAQTGFYIVYLFRHDGTAVHLSLNQGTTAVLNEVGRPRYLAVLADQARRDAGLIGPRLSRGLDTGPIDLGGRTDLSKGYQAGSIFSTTYAADALPAEPELRDDLARFMQLYKALVAGRDSLAAEGEIAKTKKGEKSEKDGNSKKRFVEAQRRRWHLRAERNSGLAKKAKMIHGTQCQVCDVVLSDIYGDIADGYIEAHHLTPFASLEGRATELDPATDFAVVCPTCHRMLHKGPPFSIAELRARLHST
jgi:5-methylcytosine-specific restriction protein A